MTMRGNVTIAAALILACMQSTLLAADMPVKAPPESAPIEYGNMYFGTDVNTNHGLVGYGGVLYAPGGMDKSGLRVSVFELFGKYRYSNEDTGTTFNGRFASVDGLIGYSQVWENGAATLQVGANWQDQRVSPFDPDNLVQGSKFGFKVQGDFWVNPTERTLVLGIASYSTAFKTYYSILRFGLDLFGNGSFIGPEVGALGNERTDQQRVGLAIVGIPISKRVALTVSGGYLHERGEKDAGYATANVDFSF
jgi:hypothetical protein